MGMKNVRLPDFEDELDKSCKNLSGQTDKQAYACIELQPDDLAGTGSGLLLHSLTALDNISVVALTREAYESKYAKKMLREVYMGFKDAFAFNPSMYLDEVVDREPHDRFFMFAGLDKLLELWKDPIKADPLDKLNAQMGELRDIYLENLKKVLERGEKLEDLQENAKGL